MKSSTTICWSWDTLIRYQYRFLAGKTLNEPDNSTAIELDIENMAVMKSAELADNLSRLDVPDFDTTVVTSADESAAKRIVGQGPDKHIMSS